MVKISKEDFIKKANAIHNNKYIYKNDYINTCTKIEIECPLHGLFIQLPRHHKNGVGCPKCSGTQKTSQEDFIKKANIIHNNKYSYKNDYINNRTKIEIECKIHGLFTQVPLNHLAGNGCRKCGREIVSLLQTTSQEDFIKKANMIHNNKYSYKNDYINNDTKIEIKCPLHGLFIQSARHHIRGVGCPRCVYKNETQTIEFLEKLTNFKFIKSRPKFLNGLELDGYNEELKLSIEYNGRQHYKYNDFFHDNDENNLMIQKERDKLKQELCANNGIYLIIVPYWVEKEKYIKDQYENYLFLNNYLI